MSRRIAAAAMVAVALLAGCGSSSKKTAATTSTAPAGPPPAALIELKNIAFTPKAVSVKTGDTVEWKFEDGAIAHNVSGPDFKSPVQSKGTFSHTFTTAGSVAYQCTLHPGMSGTIDVS